MTLVPATGEIVPHVPPAELTRQKEAINELMRAVLQHGVDYGTIPGTGSPSLLRPGAEILLKWARMGHRLELVNLERDDRGAKFGVTYRAVIFPLGDESSTIASLEAYAGRDEKKWRDAPWNTILQMAQKRALVGATKAATASSGLFAEGPPDEPHGPADWYAANGWEGGKAQHDDYKRALIARLKEASEEQIAEWRGWRENSGIPDSNTAHTRSQADLVVAHVGEILDGRAQPAPQPPAAPAPQKGIIDQLVEGTHARVEALDELTRDQLCTEAEAAGIDLHTRMNLLPQHHVQWVATWLDKQEAPF